jgi:hypothetical protein
LLERGKQLQVVAQEPVFPVLRWEHGAQVPGPPDPVTAVIR